MSLKYLSNENLDQQLRTLVVRERKLLAEIILHIEEIDRRKMYLGMAYPNLFEYLTKHLGYSDGSAQRRIDAARLIRDVPTIPEKLKSGDLSLAQVTLVQKSIRQKTASTNSSQISKEVKRSLIEEISGLSFQESQKTVAQVLDIEVKEASKVQIQKDESVRLELTFKKEDWQILQQARELLSNSLPHGSWDQVFTYLAKKEIRQKTELRSDKIKTSPHVTTAKHKVVLKKDQCCVFVDEKTGRQCGSKWFLQDDHIQPRWAGGTNDLENLQILCANHNRYKYRQQAGISSLKLSLTQRPRMAQIQLQIQPSEPTRPERWIEPQADSTVRLSSSNSSAAENATPAETAKLQVLP